MENAIKKAIEGGWKPTNKTVFLKCKNKKEILETFQFCYPDEESIKQHKHYFEYFLDPLFWQAYTTEKHGNILNINPIKAMRFWHNFIDFISNGYSPDDYFNNLNK